MALNAVGAVLLAPLAWGMDAAVCRSRRHVPAAAAFGAALDLVLAAVFVGWAQRRNRSAGVRDEVALTHRWRDSAILIV